MFMQQRNVSQKVREKTTNPTGMKVDLNNNHNELTTARNLADVAPSIDNNTALKKTKC